LALGWAVVAVHELSGGNVIQELDVLFGTETSHIERVQLPDCFSCHDDNQRANDGKDIEQDG
jgi:hypothetical protein